MNRYLYVFLGPRILGICITLKPNKFPTQPTTVKL